MEKIFLATVYTDRVAHQIAHQIHHMDDLLNKLPARFAAVPPPGSMKGIAKIAGTHQVQGTTSPEVINSLSRSIAVPKRNMNPT